jgi:hypothetical protein
MMHHGFWNKQIPTMLGLGLIIIGLSITTFLTNRQTISQTSAESNIQPQKVRITNITDNAFTVSYETDSNVSGYVNFGPNNSLGQTAFDEKDFSQKLQGHTIHSVTLKNLNPLTKYYFSIISDGNTYLNNNQNFETLTATAISDSSSESVISGKIILPNSNAPSEAIVYVTSDTSQVLSTQTSSDGTYKVNLKHLLNSDFSKLADLSANPVIKMLVYGDGLSSNALLYYSQINNIPVITLSNNYDFRIKDQVNSNPLVAPQSFSALTSTSSSKTKGIQILTPGINQTFSNQKPVLKGKGNPNQKIQITIHSQQQIQTTVSTDTNGNWSYQPKNPLSKGSHTITVTAKDSSGVLKTITQTFTVVNSTTSSTPTAVINPKTATPTIIATAYSSKPIDPKQVSPTTGNTSIVTAGITGLLITVVGGFIFLLSRKGI